MADYSPNLGSLSGQGLFASADFPDADDSRPLGATFDIGGNGSATPYSNAIQTMVMKHMSEIHGKTEAAVAMRGGWKRRLREFLTLKNTDLLDFLKISVKSHPTMGPAEALLRRFGNPNVHPDHPSVRDIIMDGSGCRTYVEELNGKLEAARMDLSGSKALSTSVRMLYDEYREAGDEVLKQQALLKTKLDKLDRIQGKLALLLEIDPSESFEPLVAATESYLEKLFAESNLETEYTALIAAYRKFVAAREVLQMIRAPAAIENEPLCCICVQETVAFAVSPCGHTFCQTCVRKQMSNCFICRGHIKDRVKIYFG